MPPTPSYSKTLHPPITLWSRYFISNWFYGWVYRLNTRAYTYKEADGSLGDSFQFTLHESESARLNGDTLENAWNEELKAQPTNPSILRALRAVYGYRYGIIGLYKIAWGIFTWLCAYYFLKVILLFVQLKEDFFVGHMYAMALFLSALLSSITIHQLYGECNVMATRIRSGLMVLIFRKSLTLSRVRGGAGEIINILSTDITRINEAVLNFHFFWSAFVEAAAVVAIAFYEVNLSALPALGFVLLLTPVQIYLGRLTSITNRDQTVATTHRVHLMSEILTAIKLVKYYSWEKPFQKKNQ